MRKTFSDEMRSSVTLILPLLLSFTFASESIGDSLLRTFLVFHTEPLTATEALSNGWYNLSTSCVPGRGYTFAPNSNGPSKGDSTWLLYNAAGQLSGFGVRTYGQMPTALVPQFWIPVRGSPDTYDIFVTFREDMCQSAPGPVLGDRVYINGNKNFSVPLTATDALAAGWYQGACIGKMGNHWSYDLANPGSMSWNASTMVPVMPMYLTGSGKIHAVLVAAPDIERIEPFGDWEGPFTRSLFCKNFCKEDAKACGNFDGVSHWTTIHWLFFDPAAATCENAKCQAF